MSKPKEVGDRGLLEYASFPDTYGNIVRVQTSSAAVHPCVWVFCQRRTNALTGERIDASPHLTVEMAKKLRDALTQWIDDASR